MTADGLGLDLSDQGRVSAVVIGKTVLPMKGEGGFSIADFKNQPETTNLIPNPGFEKGTEGWAVRQVEGQGQGVVDTTVLHSGTASLRLDVPGPEPGYMQVEMSVKVKPRTHYRAGVWLRRQQVSRCAAFISERDEQGALTGQQTQVSAPIPVQEGVWLPLTWDVTTEPATTRLSLRALIYKCTGTIWVDDFFLYECGETVYRPVEGRVEQTGADTVIRGTVPQSGLDLVAALKADGECVRVDGVIQDTTGQDRAVGVKFALPLDLVGWRWYTDAEEQETIEAEGAYRHAYECESGIGLCSIYPWSSLSGPQVGLSLALSLTQGPRVFLIQHDQRLPETSLTLYFALVKDAGMNPGRAPFSFVIYPHDPAWGMRSTMEKYYRLFPDSFVKRPTYEGYLNYADLETFQPATHELLVNHSKRLADASDFGEGYRYVAGIHGCYDFFMLPSDDPKMPSDQAAIAALGQPLPPAVESSRSRGGLPPLSETVKKLVYDADGRIRYIGDTRYWKAHEGYNRAGDKPGWGLDFRVNEDPEVSDYLAKLSRAKLEEYAKDPGRRPFDACLTADAIEGYWGNQRGLNYRREHFRTTSLPLTFGRQNLQPAMPNTIWDFHHKCWWPLSQEYKVVTYGNANGYEQFFTMPYVDIPMVETDWDVGHPGRVDRFLRAIAYHKIWRFWRVLAKGEFADKSPDAVRRHFERGLAYAIYPSVYGIVVVGGDAEPYRALYRQYVPAIEELSAAGWEPVPYATVSGNAVVERFGSFTDGTLHFTLRNYTDAGEDVSLLLDGQALGIPGATELCAIDILPGSAMVVPLEGDAFDVKVEADGARAFWIGTRLQAAARGFRLGTATLGKIERLFATELDATSRQTLNNARETAERGAKGGKTEMLEAAEQLQDMATQLGKDLKTKSPVDLAKLLFRLRAQVSNVPVALLGLESEAQRVVENASRGEAAQASWKLMRPNSSRFSDASVQVLSPWPDLEGAYQLLLGPELPASLPVPAEPPRPLLPYLLVLQEKADGVPYTVAMPVDVVVAQPLTLEVQPTQVVRGVGTKISVSVSNKLNEAAAVRVQFAAPRLCKMTPAELTLDAPARGRAQSSLILALEASAVLGELWLPYTVTSANAKFNGQGAVLVNVTDAAE